MKVLFTTNIPSPYRVDFFNELGKYCDLTVTFENQYAVSRDDEWKKYEFINFKGVFLKGKRYGEAEAICPEIRTVIKKGNFDIVVVGVYSSVTGMMAIDYMRHRKIPFILNTDGGMVKDTSGIKAWIKRRYIGAASYWLSTGNQASQYLMAYGAKKENIHVYPFASMRDEQILSKPVDMSEKKEIRERLGMKEEKIILSVGQFIYRKGYDVLLNAAKQLDEYNGIYLIGGKPTEEYQKICKDNNLKNVHFIDFMSKDKVCEYCKAADIFVLPTREDIWGLVINEALSFGLPVVTTDKCIAGLEMVEDGKNGYIVPSENEEELTNKIKMAFELDEYNAIRVAKKYSIEEMAKSHMELFERIKH